MELKMIGIVPELVEGLEILGEVSGLYAKQPSITDKVAVALYSVLHEHGIRMRTYIDGQYKTINECTKEELEEVYEKQRLAVVFKDGKALGWIDEGRNV